MTRPAPIERYLASIRRARIVYTAVVGVLLIAVGITVGVAYARGEANNTRSITVAHPPATVRLRAASADQTLAWRTTDHLAIGTPVWGGTAVTWSARTVRGRDLHTGRQTWSYYRSDRTVCTAAQIGGVTIAVYELAGNCDEVTALDSDTGARVWTRTLDENAQPVFGHPTYQASSAGFLVITSSVIYSIAPTSGEDFWTYSRYGCNITGAVLGSSGALISQNCTHPVCASLKFCKRGPQLFLRSEQGATLDQSKPNFDQIIWNDYGNTDRPATAGVVVSAVNSTTHSLDTFSSGNGHSTGPLRLSPTPSRLTSPVAVDGTDAELLWLGGYLYSVGTGSGQSNWGVRAAQPPTVQAAAGDFVPTTCTARIPVPTAGGVATVNGTTGRTKASYRLPGTAQPDVAYPVGTGFLVSGTSGTALYR